MQSSLRKLIEQENNDEVFGKCECGFDGEKRNLKIFEFDFFLLHYQLFITTHWTVFSFYAFFSFSSLFLFVGKKNLLKSEWRWSSLWQMTWEKYGKDRKNSDSIFVFFSLLFSQFFLSFSSIFITPTLLVQLQNICLLPVLSEKREINEFFNLVVHIVHTMIKLFLQSISTDHHKTTRNIWYHYLPNITAEVYRSLFTFEIYFQIELNRKLQSKNLIRRVAVV